MNGIQRPLKWLYARLVKDGYPKIAVCVAGLIVSTFIINLSYVAHQIVSDYIAIIGLVMLVACSVLLIISISMVVWHQSAYGFRSIGAMKRKVEDLTVDELVARFNEVERI